jgi:hypothetical protein
MGNLIDDPGERSRRLVQNAARTARTCSINAAARAETELMAQVIEA